MQVPRVISCVVVASALAALPSRMPAQEGRPPTVTPAPDRQPGEGEGPFARLLIRGATVIDGTGAPGIGPMDVVIEGNRIVSVRRTSRSDLAADTVPAAQGTRDLDARGMFLLPGFVDVHAHIGGEAQGTPATYVYKLWLAHGVTTVRDPGSGNGIEWTLGERERSRANAIVAPRIFVYARPGRGWDRGPIDTPDQAREWVRWAARKGVDGLKLGSHDPAIMAALIDEARVRRLGTQAHLGQMGVARMDALDAARLGLGSLEHWYGLPEALFDDRSVQDFPFDYNYSNEYHRFGQAGRLWQQAAGPDSDHWRAVMDELLALRFVLDPTMTIYEASRDVMRAREAEWHDTYTLPSLWRFYQPSRESHGSYWLDWTTQDEIEWKRNYQRWMRFLDEYKDRGGRVCTGSDAGFIYKLYGFAFVRELELLQEAGFHPLEVVRSATLCGAEVLHEPQGQPVTFGIIRPGMLADLILVDENPIRNLKVLYGTGAVRLNDATGAADRVGGVRLTIKDGIIYDAKQLLADVAQMVAEANRAASAQP